MPHKSATPLLHPIPEGATQSDLDKWLDAGRLYAEMNHGRHWLLRRNGATKTWKREPGRYRIPCKAGLKACGAIEPHNLYGYKLADA